MAIDDLDMQIIRSLWDGRTPFSDIAEKVGVTTNTVRARVQHLVERGVLQIMGMVNPEALPGHQAAFIGFKADSRRVPEIAEQIRQLKGVGMVVCVSGHFDIIASVLLNEKFSYRDFVFQELAKIDGLQGFEPFFVMKGNEFRVRYVL